MVESQNTQTVEVKLLCCKHIFWYTTYMSGHSVEIGYLSLLDRSNNSYRLDIATNYNNHIIQNNDHTNNIKQQIPDIQLEQ